MSSEKQSYQPAGMAAFIVIWLGQLVSMLGTAMTQFALTIWAYQETGQATSLALVGFFYVTPLLVLSPVAGALVDRSNRKMMMVVSDAGAGLATLIVLILYSMGWLEVWHLYLTALLTGATEVFQWPAYSASISTMLKKEQYGRAFGMISLAGEGSRIFAPILAAALWGYFGLGAILWIDVITFTFAISTILVVAIPQPEKSAEGLESKGSLWSESIFGFKYIWQRKGLLGLQMVFMFGNFFATWAGTIIAPAVLARTMNDSFLLGSTQSAGAIGGVIGGLVMSAWGGPKKLVHGVFLGWSFSGLLGTMLFGIGPSWEFWMVASFFSAMFIPLINGSNQAIWQRKVPPDLQGRVFSIRRLVAWLVNPLATLSVGPLADFVFEPAMREGGVLAPYLGRFFGVGPGSGMMVIIFFSGFMMTIIGLLAYLFSEVREVEKRLPDHTQEVVA